MAQIINKKNPIIITSTRTRGYCSITIKKTGIYISKQVALLCNLKPDKFVHFINDANYWAFYVNDDPDGFAISSDHANGGFVLYNRILSKLFLASVRGAVLNSRYLIISSNARHNGSTVYEIITTASVDVVINRRKRMQEQKQILREFMEKQNAA